MEQQCWEILEKIIKNHAYVTPWLPKDALRVMSEFFEELTKQNISLSSSNILELNKIIKENLTKKGFPFKINNN